VPATWTRLVELDEEKDVERAQEHRFDREKVAGQRSPFPWAREELVQALVPLRLTRVQFCASRLSFSATTARSTEFSPRASPGVALRSRLPIESPSVVTMRPA
jgi:hypothetical protein